MYYERRTNQYDRLDIEKTRIITPANMIRAFAAMFLNEPHRATRNFAALKAKVGDGIFEEGHRKEPYYVAAFTLYRLEYLFRSRQLDPKYKPARFHILLAARLIVADEKLPRMNSHDMQRYCHPLMERLWDYTTGDLLIRDAATVIDVIANSNFHRDNIRTEPFTQGLVRQIREGKRRAAERIQQAGSQAGAE